MYVREKTSSSSTHLNKFLKKKKGDSYLLEELRHLAHQTGVALHLAFVSVGQEEVTQQRGVCQRLDDAVHEARVAQVYQTSQALRGGEKGNEKQAAKKRERERTGGGVREE